MAMGVVLGEHLNWLSSLDCPTIRPSTQMFLLMDRETSNNIHLQQHPEWFGMESAAMYDTVEAAAVSCFRI